MYQTFRELRVYLELGKDIHLTFHIIMTMIKIRNGLYGDIQEKYSRQEEQHMVKNHKKFSMAERWDI